MENTPMLSLEDSFEVQVGQATKTDHPNLKYFRQRKLNMNKLVITFITLLVAASCQPSSNSPSLSCTFIEGLESTGELRCGEILVPENHDEPNGKKIKITYVIVQARDKETTAFPMIYLSGGPGGASLSAGRIKGWLSSPLRDTRDIVLLDQRGIGYSSALTNINEEVYGIFEKDLNEDEELTMMKELISAYRTKCEAENIQLQHYNSFQNAKDVGMLMKHLAYSKYNIYGVSYGTRLGRVVQELFPDLLNSVILNSPNPIKGDFLIDRMNSYSLALSRVIDYCKNSADCSTQYPDLEAEYLRTINALKEKPLELDIDGVPFFVNAQDGVYFIRRKLYANDSRSGVPMLIRELQNGGGPILTGIIENEFGPDYNYPMWLSVERHEMFNPDNTKEVIDEAYAVLPLLPAKLALFTPSYLSLRDLHSSTLSQEMKVFQTSAVPTMITVNQFDPVTPPENGKILMERLSSGMLFIMDEGGHGGGDVDCRNKVMTAFMDAPNAELDASCLNLYTEQ
ncbi:MAG: alpha/beta fold hydrolase [Cyclobacteriaceae bacterium]